MGRIYEKLNTQCAYYRNGCKIPANCDETGILNKDGRNLGLCHKYEKSCENGILDEDGISTLMALGDSIRESENPLQTLQEKIREAGIVSGRFDSEISDQETYNQ